MAGGYGVDKVAPDNAFIALAGRGVLVEEEGGKADYFHFLAALAGGLFDDGHVEDERAVGGEVVKGAVGVAAVDPVVIGSAGGI